MPGEISMTEDVRAIGIVLSIIQVLDGEVCLFESKTEKGDTGETSAVRIGEGV